MATHAFNLSVDVQPSAVKAGAHVPFVAFGKCRKCRERVRLAGTVAGFWVRSPATRGPLLWLDVAGEPRRTIRHDVARFGILANCDCGGDAVTFPIEARTTEHTCGAACRHAKGATCDCSCGGENHGAG